MVEWLDTNGYRTLVCKRFLTTACSHFWVKAQGIHATNLWDKRLNRDLQFTFSFLIRIVMTVGIDETKCKHSHFISIGFHQLSSYTAHIFYLQFCNKEFKNETVLENFICIHTYPIWYGPYHFEWSKVKSRPIAHQVSGSSRKHTESLMTCFFRAESGIWRNPILSIMNAWNLPHEDWPDCLQTCPRKMNSKLWLTRFSGRGRERQERDKRPSEGTPIQEKTGLCYKSSRSAGKRSVCYKTHLDERYSLHCSMICQVHFGWIYLAI